MRELGLTPSIVLALLAGFASGMAGIFFAIVLLLALLILLVRRLVRLGHGLHLLLADARQAALDEAEKDHLVALRVEALVAVVSVHAVRCVARKVRAVAPQIGAACAELVERLKAPIDKAIVLLNKSRRLRDDSG